MFGKLQRRVYKIRNRIGCPPSASVRVLWVLMEECDFNNHVLGVLIEECDFDSHVLGFLLEECDFNSHVLGSLMEECNFVF